MSMKWQQIVRAVLCGFCAVFVEAGSCSDTTAPVSKKSSLVVLERSATTLKLQWGSIGVATTYTVDYLTGISSCQSAVPTHNNVQVVSATSVTVTGLLPSTAYHVHVHALVGAGPTVDSALSESQSVFVMTLATGAATQSVTAADYVTC